MNDSRRSFKAGFTLVELLTVVLIISVLLALLIPVANKVRKASQAATVSNQISVIGQAIDNYFHDFHAYPGPVANINIGPGATPAVQDQITALAPGSGNLLGGGAAGPSLTMSENLVLGVIGGLKLQGNQVVYDPALIFPNIITPPASVANPNFATGAAPGPNGLNPGLPKRYGSYMPAQDLSQGYYHDDIINSLSAPLITGKDKAIADTIVPEFLDKFPSRMPILYLRARVGATTSGVTSADNPIVTDGSNRTTMGQYDISQIQAYTQNYGAAPNILTVGEGKSPPTYYSNGSVVPSAPLHPYHGLTTVTPGATLGSPGSATYTYPYDAYAYFSHPTLNNIPRQKDGYILISAGVDRIYGTNDDICSFGSLQQ